MKHQLGRAQDRYESVLEHVADTEELHNVIMEMIGELNASHTGISGGGLLAGEAAPVRLETRNPGFSLAPDAASGYYRVDAVQRNGPADKDYFKVAPENYILAVNGAEFKISRNYWELLNVLPGRKLEFLVNSKLSADGAWPLVIEPFTRLATANLEYS